MVADIFYNIDTKTLVLFHSCLAGFVLMSRRDLISVSDGMLTLASVTFSAPCSSLTEFTTKLLIGIGTITV